MEIGKDNMRFVVPFFPAFKALLSLGTRPQFIEYKTHVQTVTRNSEVSSRPFKLIFRCCLVDSLTIGPTTCSFHVSCRSVTLLFAVHVGARAVVVSPT
jgi:hypothetical protein